MGAIALEFVMTSGPPYANATRVAGVALDLDACAQVTMISAARQRKRKLAVVDRGWHVHHTW